MTAQGERDIFGQEADVITPSETRYTPVTWVALVCLVAFVPVAELLRPEPPEVTIARTVPGLDSEPAPDPVSVRRPAPHRPRIFVPTDGRIPLIPAPAIDLTPSREPGDLLGRDESWEAGRPERQERARRSIAILRLTEAREAREREEEFARRLGRFE